MPVARPVSERLWVKVEIAHPRECWLWAAGTNPRGYGGIGRNGRTALAHRVAWEEFYGPIPEGLFVLHSCDNPPCCNPFHLFLGSALDNMRDCIAKGRRPAKTHCPQGHAYSPENTYIAPSSGAPVCRQCQGDHVRAFRARQRMMAVL